MTDENERQWCWPFTHDWTKWQDDFRYEKRHADKGNVYEMGIVQERRCKLCNKAHRRMVSDGY